MQNNDTRDTLVGGLVIFSLAVLFAFSYGGKQLSAQASVGSYRVTAVFDRVDGLYEGDEVRLGGIRIGTVGAQQLDEHYRAVVSLNIKDGVDVPVDSAAAIHTDGLFGSKFIVLEPGVEEQSLQSGDDIEYTQGAMIVGELLNLIIDEGNAKQGTSEEQGN